MRSEIESSWTSTINIPVFQCIFVVKHLPTQAFHSESTCVTECHAVGVQKVDRGKRKEWEIAKFAIGSWNFSGLSHWPGRRALLIRPLKSLSCCWEKGREAQENEHTEQWLQWNAAFDARGEPTTTTPHPIVVQNCWM